MEQLFGREEYLARIALFLDSLGQGGDVRMVRGEPGVGKSALLAAGGQMARERGYLVLNASGSEFEADISYSFLHQMLMPLQTEVQRLPPGLRDALGVALGYGPGTPPSVLLVCNAALSLLTTVARRAPVVLLVDDVQWVDRASAVVLGFITRRIQAYPVGVVMCTRTGSESLLDQRGFAESVVLPLSPEASTQFVRARHPNLPAHLLPRLLELAEGNPLALAEMPQTLLRTAAPEALGHEPEASDPVQLSERLQTMFTGRLAELPDRTVRLLLLATLEGSGNLQLLDAVADLADLAPAEQAQLVLVEDGPDAKARITFRHPLIRSAIVAMTSPEERRQAHRALADALLHDPERRAWHLGSVASGPDDGIADQLTQAAYRVLQRGDVLGSVQFLVRASELSVTTQDTARRLAEAAYIGVEGGGTGADLSTLLADAQASNLGPTGSLHAANAAALLMINSDGDVPTAHRLLAGAIEMGEHGWRADDPALDEAMHTLLRLSWYAGNPQLWQVFNSVVGRITPEPPDLLRVASQTFPDPVRTGAAALPALDRLLSTVDHDDVTRAMRLSTASIYVDRLGVLRDFSWQLVRQGRDGDGGTPRRLLSALAHLCLDDYLTGRWEEGEKLALEGHQVSNDSGLPFLSWYFLYGRAIIAAGRGRSDEAIRLADEITHWALPRGVGGGVTLAHHPRTLAASAEGDFESAYLHASAISPAGSLAPYTPVATWVMFDLVEAALRTGRTAEAAAHAQAGRDAGVAALSPRMTLLQHGMDALVLGTPEAEDRLENTLQDKATDRWLFEASRIQLAFAETLRRRKDFSRARTHLLSARSGFSAMGAELWLARASAELRATGYRTGALQEESPPSPLAGLTGQEREIAELAAGGLTNKQIAQRLFLSHRTVGSHLYRIFPKLGITSRAGLRDALSGNGPTRNRAPRSSSDLT